MRKSILFTLCVLLLFTTLFTGCEATHKKVKIGVSFGVGEAKRWEIEAQHMETRAKELGVDIEVRLNRTDEPKTQQEDCFELIDSGINVLILTPRDVSKCEEILAYAKEKKIPVVSYARVVLGDEVDLFVGYDSERIGQKMGQYLAEMVYQGDYLLLRGDANDYNATLLYNGAMRYIDPLKEEIRIIGDYEVPKWSTETAKELVLEAVKANGNKVDAILAPNDALAGACLEALQELGVTTPVVITGMDADLVAVQRILKGQQGMTVYMDLTELAATAMDQAYNLATGKEPVVNAEFDNQGNSTVASNLVTGQLVTKDNIDKVLVESGYYTEAQIEGTEK